MEIQGAISDFDLFGTVVNFYIKENKIK